METKSIATVSVASPIQMELFSPLELRNEIRIDRIFSQSMWKIDEQFNEDAGLLKSLILFFHNEIQNNVYGVGFFDVKRFSEMMGYSISKLQHKHPNPRQLMGMNAAEKARLYELEAQNPESNKIWDSNLENALYTLVNCNVVLNYDASFSDERNNIINSAGISSQKYLERVDMIFQKSSEKSLINKKVYIYHLDRDFVDKTLRWYQYIDISLVPFLQRKNLENIFFLLAGRVGYLLYDLERSKVKKSNQWYESLYSIYFNTAKKIFCCDSAINRENKRKIEKKMKELTEIVNSHCDFKIKYYWDKENPKSSFSYMLVIKLFISGNKIKNEHDHYENYSRTEDEFCCMELYHSLYRDLFPEQYHQGTILGKFGFYFKWLCDDTVNFQEKCDVIKRCMLKVNPDSNWDNNRYINERVARQLKHLKEINSSFLELRNAPKMIAPVVN